jgi:hypothetical protein
MKRSFEDCRDPCIVLRRLPTTNIRHDWFTMHTRPSGPQLDLLPDDIIDDGKDYAADYLLHLAKNRC